MNSTTQIKNQRIGYRAEINGLRAVAVILVLLYHLDYTAVGAGFLGVDVFLVISGYLISRNILNDLESNQFSFTNFYTRRFKRLFPALFLTLLASLIAGFFLLAPANLEQLSKTAMSGVLFCSNIFFLSQTGYFDTESAFNPLLHIWSLSLEEQFYFIWPLLLLAIFRISRKLVFPVIVLLVFLSAGAAEYYNNNHPANVFYLLPFRFFEFHLGALCIWLERHQSRFKLVGEFALLLGLVLIGYSAVKYNMNTPMPGFRAFVPCVGAMLVIYGGNTKYVGWLLRNKTIEIIGKTSYSIYLVHWPLIVFYKYYTLSELTGTSKVVLGATSFFLGFFMWKYIENTFRTTTVKFRETDAIWIWMPALMVLLSVATWQVLLNKGYPWRYPAEYTMTSEQIMDNRKRYWDGSSGNDVIRGTENKKIIVMGNSHAIDLMYALRKNGLTANIIAYPTGHLCFNFGAMPIDNKDRELCDSRLKIFLADTNWARSSAIYLFDNWPVIDTISLGDLLNKIRLLSAAPVYVFGPKMILTRDVHDIVHSCRSSSSNAINKSAQEHTDKVRYKVNAALHRFFEDPSLEKRKIYFVDILKIQGNGTNQFDVLSPETGDFLYFDKDHFTEQGAKEFGTKLKTNSPELFTLSFK